HSVHSTHVVNSVHLLIAAPYRACIRSAHGSFTFATPIIESRVTRRASSSSLSFSEPAGLSGSTRYRTSAVLSQTRTSTSPPGSIPNSRRTPRRSMTEPDRYGADLYHTGGRPSTGHGEHEQSAHTTKWSTSVLFSTTPT